MDEAWRSELAEFIAIPSVSADPAHREDVKRAGEWVCDFIRRIGGTAELTPFGEKELALGEIPASNGADERADRPRLQPLRRPAAGAARALGVRPVRARRSAASGPTRAASPTTRASSGIVLKAAQRLVEASALPVNLRFACDGEEEIGGHTIVDWIAQDERGADAAVIFDGGMLRRDVPTIELATRGLVGVRREGADRRARPPLRACTAARR